MRTVQPVFLTLSAHEAVLFETPKVVDVAMLSSGLRLMEIRLRVEVCTSPST